MFAFLDVSFTLLVTERNSSWISFDQAKSFFLSKIYSFNQDWNELFKYKNNIALPEYMNVQYLLTHCTIFKSFVILINVIMLIAYVSMCLLSSFFNTY